MSYSHDSEADFAASELARMFAADPRLCYDSTLAPASLNTTATYEPSSSGWPKADGLISLLESIGGVQRDIALEYKRPQEGLHGLLTAIGQAHGYLHKGYSGAAIVIPSTYSSHSSPAEYVREVLDKISGSKAIGVFRYEPPDTTSVTPFKGRLHCVRPLIMGAAATAGSGVLSTHGGSKTQWVHMREGSTTRDAFFRFLQMAKLLSADAPIATPNIPIELRQAVERISPGRGAEAYLANTADDKFLSRVWRAFWFEWVATNGVLTPWVMVGSDYVTPDAMTRIMKDDKTGHSQIFEGRANGLKETLVALLNSKAIDESKAWELFAAGIVASGTMQNKQGVRDRAHSYREDLDSSLSQLEWIENDGRPTDRGYRYMNICERFGGANSPASIEYCRATLLQTGRYASFLHYVYRLSERQFATNPLAFTEEVRGLPVFNEKSYADYLAFLEEQLTNELRVMRKVSGRARPRVRTPFQAELTLLRNYNFVSKAKHRLGVGIPIDWEQVVEALKIEL